MEYSAEWTIENFSLEETLFCGQCFLWTRREDGGFDGATGGRPLILSQRDTVLTAQSSRPIDRDALLRYLGLDEDYTRIQALLSRDETLRTAISYASGIRVMKQPLWEALVCFIVSQNNNIPRITGILERFCRCFGGVCEDGHPVFPDADTLARCTVDDLAPLRCGFRAKYLIDAAQKYTGGLLSETLLRTAPLNEARAHLMTVYGVGPKVANCVLLFGAQRYDAFPEDVWIKRAMARLFPQGLPDFARPYAGIAQQYIFHYARTSGIFAQTEGGAQMP